jgi:carboxylate-amine ligase
MKAKTPLHAFGGYGIEIEYMLVDRNSLDVRPIADELLRAAAGRVVAEVERDGMGWSRELGMHVLEIKNPAPQPDLAALLPAFQAEVRAIDALLEPEHARLLPGGMHPWMDPSRQTRIWSHDASAAIYRSYDRIFDCRRHGWANIQSMHLNLPFAGDAEFARLHAAVRLVLPILPALAASSPFAEGRYSGWLDYRLEVYRTHQARIPASLGELIPDESTCRADYHERVLLPIYREIVAHDIEAQLRHEWINARAAIPRFERNAIEIRVLDTQECPLADLAVAAAVVALVQRLYERAVDFPDSLPTGDLARILHACSRDAEQALIDDPHYLALFGAARPCQARDLWAQLVDEMLTAESLAAVWAEPLSLILERGPLARRLLEAVGREAPSDRLHAAYHELSECLHDGRMYLPAPGR